MKEKELKSWEKTREKGLVKFCFINGVLAWGVPMLIAMAFLNKPFSEGWATKAAITHCIIWPIAGVFFGLGVWYVSESRYKKEISKRENT